MDQVAVHVTSSSPSRFRYQRVLGDTLVVVVTWTNMTLYSASSLLCPLEPPCSCPVSPSPCVSPSPYVVRTSLMSPPPFQSPHPLPPSPVPPHLSPPPSCLHFQSLPFSFSSPFAPPPTVPWHPSLPHPRPSLPCPFPPLPFLPSLPPPPPRTPPPSPWPWPLPSPCWTFSQINRILRGFQTTHQQFKSSADLDETDTSSQQPHNNINQMLHHGTGIRRRVGDESPHTWDECKTQRCHVVVSHRPQQWAVLLRDACHKSSSNQHHPRVTENTPKPQCASCPRSAHHDTTHQRFDNSACKHIWTEFDSSTCDLNRVLNRVRQDHRVTRKNKDTGHPAIHEKVPHSSPPGLSHQKSHQGCSTVGLFSLADCLFTLVICLSCMTCSFHRNMYDPDLKLRRRHSTASPLSFVRPSTNCSTVGAQRITQPVFFTDSRMISKSMADRLSCSVDGLPTADRWSYKLLQSATHTGGLSCMTARAPCRSNGPWINSCINSVAHSTKSKATDMGCASAPNELGTVRLILNDRRAIGDYGASLLSSNDLSVTPQM